MDGDDLHARKDQSFEKRVGEYQKAGVMGSSVSGSYNNASLWRKTSSTRPTTDAARLQGKKSGGQKLWVYKW